VSWWLGTAYLMQRLVVRLPPPPGGPSSPCSEDGGQIATPGGPIASKSAVVRAACYRGGQGHRWRYTRTCTHCCSVVRTLSTSAGHTTATSRCSTCCLQRTVSPPRRQEKTSNLLLHDDVRAMKAAISIESATK
jgi:hypothetical protein